MNRFALIGALAAAVLLLLAAPPPASAKGKKWKKEFAQGWASENSWERRAAITVIDPQDKNGVKALLKLLAEERISQVDPHIRQEIIAALAMVEDKKALKALDKGFKAKQDRVREGVVLALGLRADAADLDRLIAATADKKSARVRRAAVRALRGFAKDPKAVEAILKAWKEAKEASRMAVECSVALAAMTGRDDGLSRGKWGTWWNAAKDEYPEQEEATSGEDGEEKPPEKEKMVTRTRVKGIDLAYTERGQGTTPLLVIPDEQYTTDLYKPYFRTIEDIYKVYYMELPLVTGFDQSKLKQSSVRGIPEYPVALLVEAFEALRKELKVERFAFMSHGYNALVAQLYLSLYPQNVSHVIMIAPISGNQAWGKILTGVQAKGQGTKDPEMVHMARNMLVFPDGKHDYEPRDKTEKLALRRKAFNIYFADTNDPMIEDLFTKVFKGVDLPESMSPDFELARQKKARVPILVQMGAQSPWTAESDQKRFTDHYPVATVRTYARSSMCPFIEETAAWSRDIHAFHDKHSREKGKN